MLWHYFDSFRSSWGNRAPSSQGWKSTSASEKKLIKALRDANTRLAPLGKAAREGTAKDLDVYLSPMEGGTEEKAVKFAQLERDILIIETQTKGIVGVGGTESETKLLSNDIADLKKQRFECKPLSEQITHTHGLWIKQRRETSGCLTR